MSNGHNRDNIGIDVPLGGDSAGGQALRHVPVKSLEEHIKLGEEGRKNNNFRNAWIFFPFCIIVLVFSEWLGFSASADTMKYIIGALVAYLFTGSKEKSK